VAKTGLLLGSLMVAFLLAELAVRVLPSTEFLREQPRIQAVVGEFPNRQNYNFVEDSLIGWRMLPSHQFVQKRPDREIPYVANRQGFRSPHDYAEPAPAAKIALIGDSFTFGLGVAYDETFGALIERAYPGSTLYNFSQPGFAIDQMWMVLRHHALPLDPQLIIVAFIDNDFDRSLTAYRVNEGFNKPTFVLDDGELRPQRPSDRGGALVRELERRVLLWGLGRNVVRGLGYRWGIGDWWRINAAILQQMAEDARAAGVPILFVRLPSESWRDFPMYRTLMNEIDAAYLDLGAADSAPPYGIHFEKHLNLRGHEYVAERLIDWMDRNWRPATRDRGSPVEASLQENR